MNNWFINNRELIKNLAINTGTTAVPVYTGICTTSEVSVTTDLNTKDFYVFCDALQRKIITGASVTLSGTLKLDVNNTGDLALLDKVHTLIGDGEVAQFSNVEIRFIKRCKWWNIRIHYLSSKCFFIIKRFRW